MPVATGVGVILIIRSLVFILFRKLLLPDCATVDTAMWHAHAHTPMDACPNHGKYSPCVTLRPPRLYAPRTSTLRTGTL